jgi:competence protein ComEC
VQNNCTGIPIDTITNFSGHLLSDAQSMDMGHTLYEINIFRVWDAAGTASSADYNMLLLVKNGLPYKWGSVLGCIAQFPVNANSEGTPTIIVPSSHVAFYGYKSPFYKYRQYSSRMITNRIESLPYNLTEMLEALLMGNQDGLDPGIKKEFRQSGCIHILALSGMHLGIILLVISKSICMVIPRKPARIISICICFCYLLIVGVRPSLLRAFLMFSVYYFSSILSNKTDPINILSITFIINILIDPGTVFAAGFILSYTAMAGIFLFTKRIALIIPGCITTSLSVPLAASMSVQLLSAPLTLLLFGSYYPIGLIAGIPLGALITVFIILGIFYLAAGFIGFIFLENIFAWILNIFYLLIAKMVKFFSFAPGVEHAQWWVGVSGIVVSVGIIVILYGCVKLRLPKRNKAYT